jgi:hypothetical protein
MSFLDRCAVAYGKEVVLGSRVPWLSVLEFPGNLQLVDSAKAISLVTSAQSVFLSFNSEPWQAMKQWENASPLEDEVALLLDGQGQPTPDYLGLREEPQIGAIAELWKDWSDSTLFATLIDIVSQAWQITPTDLVQEKEWTHEKDEIFGRFKRN